MRRRTAGSRASTKSIHKPARSLRVSASLLSTFSPLAGVTAKPSRAIKPRELDLRSLRLFVLVRFLTRPTNHPRHAACASNYESKPVRPPFLEAGRYLNRRCVASESPTRRKEIPCAANLAAARVADAGAESVRQLGRHRCFELRRLFR